MYLEVLTVSLSKVFWTEESCIRSCMGRRGGFSININIKFDVERPRARHGYRRLGKLCFTVESG